MSPAERDSSEPPPLVLERDHFVARIDVALRVVALVVAAGLTGMAVWLVAFAWRLFADQWAGRVPMDTSFIWIILSLAALYPVIRKMWLTARRGVNPALDAAEVAAVESRAFLEAVERHDLLRVEAQKQAAAEVGGALETERRPGARELDEPGDRDYESRIANRMKERGEPE